MLTNSHIEPCSDHDCVHCIYISNIKRAKPSSDSKMSVDQKKKRLHNSELCVGAEQKLCTDMFCNWSGGEQVDFICQLLSKVSHFQQSQINGFLDPLLKRDFIVSLQSRGVPYLAEMILIQLDAASLLSVEFTSRGWQWSVAKYQLWRRLFAHRIATDPVWYGLCERRGWLELINHTDPAYLSTLLERHRVPVSRQASSDFSLLHNNALNVFECDISKLSPNPESRNQNMLIHSASSNQQLAFQMSHGHEFFQDGYNMSIASSNQHFNLNNSISSEQQDAVSHEVVMFAHRFYKQLYPRIIRDIAHVEDNWIRGHYHLTRISCRSDVTKGVYCLQYDKEKIVSGLRDDTIKVWKRIPNFCSNVKKTKGCTSQFNPVSMPIDLSLNLHKANRSRGDESANPAADLEVPNPVDGLNATTTAASASSDGYHCTQVLEGHSGSVLCLQYIGNLLISGSSDTNVRLWDLLSGTCLNVICHHTEAVLHLRFRNNILVTCSKDRSIAVWDMGPWPKDVQLRQVLVGHRAAVNVVDFDDKYIVSASGDRTIKVWATDTCTYVRTLTGHRRGIACLQYRDRLVVSGSSDNTIRIWDIETGVCFRVLEGHEELVRCIRFDSKRIVSGAYDGKIKVWNLKAALNPRSKPNQLCIYTLQQHTGRVFRLQFDDFQIVSSSHDDTILIWDFACHTPSSEERDDGFDDGINAALASSQAVCNCGGQRSSDPMYQATKSDDSQPAAVGTNNILADSHAQSTSSKTNNPLSLLSSSSTPLSSNPQLPVLIMNKNINSNLILAKPKSSSSPSPCFIKPTNEVLMMSNNSVLSTSNIHSNTNATLSNRMVNNGLSNYNAQQNRIITIRNSVDGSSACLDNFPSSGPNNASSSPPATPTTTTPTKIKGANTNTNSGLSVANNTLPSSSNTDQRSLSKNSFRNLHSNFSS